MKLGERIKKKERILVTTLTKNSWRFNCLLSRLRIKVNYMHSDVDTLERIEIIHSLRKGRNWCLSRNKFIKRGLRHTWSVSCCYTWSRQRRILRSRRALVQTIGRAARKCQWSSNYVRRCNYDLMQAAIDETNRRRKW